MARKFVRAIFPGTFDPITNGHLDVIHRGRKLFDELIIAVGRSPVKNQLFMPEERVEMIAELIADMPGVSVESFDGLTVEYAAKKKADFILRGLRSLTDVQYEFQLAMTNRAVAAIETVFIMTGEQYGFTSSTLIREAASLGGDVSNLIPKSVYNCLQEHLKKVKREEWSEIRDTLHEIRDMFTVSVETHFWASHQLTLPDGSKESLHHHNWAVTADISSSKPNSLGLVMDFSQLKAMLDNIVAEFDNSPLDEIDYFKRNNSSAENVAKYIYEKLKPKLPDGLKLNHIRVVEEPGCSAKFGE